MKENIFVYKEKYGKILLIFSILIIFFILINIFVNSYNKDLEITFFDIGQGDSALIKMPSDEKILIDAGPDNLILNRLGDKYSFLEKKNIDIAILTHPDSDHITGFASILKDYKVKNILENGDDNKNSSIYEEILQKINIEKNETDTNIYNANCGDIFSFDEIKNKDNINIYILHPVKNNLSSIETNDNSIVFLLTYNKYSFLFTGDASKEAEKKILFNINRCFDDENAKIIQDYMKNLTVLKVSHHGSNTSSGEEFLKYIKPVYAVISAGKNNRYGHPDPNTLNIIKKDSDYTLNTIYDGNISFITNGKDIEIKKTK